jgi:enamidase
VILGTDGPAGSGVQPLGILRMVAMLSSIANIPAELVFCLWLQGVFTFGICLL